ncbi:BTAD domain-containing putative transcriptional regulator, partial [Streptomyces sp. NPDC004976]
MPAYETSVRFSVLGPVRAWRGEQELDLGSPQQRVVLAALLLSRGRPLALGELIRAVWGEEPPTAAVSVLRTYVSRLRKILEPGRNQGEPPRLLVSVGDGYLLRIQEDALDLAVFERRVAEARKRQTEGELSAAAELLHTALGAWQGPALAGLPGPLAESECSWLDEQRFAALETRLDIDVSLGRHDTVVPELLSLVHRHPLRERLSGLLMLALYRSGRQAEALAAYQGARDALVAELGVEPGTPLQDLHDRILAADPTLLPAPPPAPDRHSRPATDIPGGQDSPTATAHPAGPRALHPGHHQALQPTDPQADHQADHQADPQADHQAIHPADPHADHRPAVRPAQLPADLPTFTGRQAELALLRALLPPDGSPPATLVISAIGGMGGIGKSALAVHWAHEVADRFPDGQLHINLRGFDPSGSVMTPDEAVRIFLDALGVPPMRIPAGVDAQVALYRSMLARRRMLILLDNARDTEQVRPLLPGSRGSLVVVTSRNRLAGLVAG